MKGIVLVDHVLICSGTVSEQVFAYIGPSMSYGPIQWGNNVPFPVFKNVLNLFIHIKQFAGKERYCFFLLSILDCP